MSNTVYCPYCGQKNTTSDVIDESFINTKHVFACRECGEVFESNQRNSDYSKPVDFHFDRNFQYCRGNLDINAAYDMSFEEGE